MRSKIIPADVMGLDIGSKTCRLFCDANKSSGTVVMNGPMGVFVKWRNTAAAPRRGFRQWPTAAR